jgi:hypothetical protein
MPYLVGERDQKQLFPASIEEYIGPENPVRAYDAFVEQVDFAYLGIELPPDFRTPWIGETGEFRNFGPPRFPWVIALPALTTPDSAVR